MHNPHLKLEIMVKKSTINKVKIDKLRLIKFLIGGIEGAK
jgi:hypothetical protein